MVNVCIKVGRKTEVEEEDRSGEDDRSEERRQKWRRKEDGCGDRKEEVDQRTRRSCNGCRCSEAFHFYDNLPRVTVVLPHRICDR